MADLLEIDGVMLYFGPKMVLQNICLKLDTGKVTGLLGRNGSGKSCLMKIIFGELEPNDKSLRINGVPILGCARNRSDVMYLPQFDFIPNHLSVKRVFGLFGVEMGRFMEYFPHFGEVADAVPEHVLPYVGDRKMRQLSGGEKRLVEVYCILCSKTKFVILDEPFSQIMPIYVEVLKQIISAEKLHKGILISDHYYRDIIDVSDHIYVLVEGKTTLISNLQQIEELGYARMG